MIGRARIRALVSRTPRRPVRTLRVVRGEVDGELLVLHGEVLGDPADGGSPPPMSLVLRERTSGEELRFGLEADGAEGELSAGIDTDALWSGAGDAVWEVRAEVDPPDDRAGTCPLVSGIDAALAPSVVLERDGQLHRVRVRASAAGRLTVAVQSQPPHAEVQRVLVEDDAVVVEAVLDRTDPPGDRPTALVAVSRERKVEVSAPAAVEGPTVRGRLALDALAADVAGTEYWDLSVHVEGRAPLRLGGHLDDVADKKRAIAYPTRRVPSPAGGRSLMPYFTVHNNLSIRSTPARAGSGTTRPRAPSAGRKGGDPVARAIERKAIHLARWAAMPVARAVVRRLPSRRPVPPVQDGRPHVAILIVHGYGMGGTVRTVFNQAAQLSRDHQVEILSQFREREEPFFAVPPGVTLTPLDDRTNTARPAWPSRVVRSWCSRLPSLLVHEADVTFARCTLWTDVQLVRRLRAQRGGILMATRPSLNLLIARLAAPGVITVGQDHMNFHQYRREIAEVMHREYRRLDALTVLTQGDLGDYTATLAGSSTRVVRIPNAVSPLTGGLADPTSRIVVAAGRLTNQKGFDRLIPAFEQVVREHPEWTLRIYGSGPHRARLEKIIRDRDLYNNVRLMGRANSMGEELAKASIYAMSSRFEGFPMVLLEAMSKRLAVVSFDCPRGPSDLITPGTDGLLVPEGDVDGLARALLRLVEDEELRRRFGAAALRTAGRYDAEAVGRQWGELLADLLAERSARGRLRDG